MARRGTALGFITGFHTKTKVKQQPFPKRNRSIVENYFEQLK
jgi:hypothetical protein